MLLKNLIKNSPKSMKKLKIKGLALNSKDVKKGFIFFAIKGTKLNGERYIDKAIKNGAIIIICSKSCKFQSAKVNVGNVDQCWVVRTLIALLTEEVLGSVDLASKPHT